MNDLGNFNEYREAIRVLVEKADHPRLDRVLMALISCCFGASYVLMYVYATN